MNQPSPGASADERGIAGVDTRDLPAVEEQVCQTYCGLFPAADRSFVARAFGWARQCFNGKWADYLPVDARYHDLEHTLQGTLCLSRLLAGRCGAGEKPELTRRGFELALLAILFHDTGYLKKRDDSEGTGAKYTLTHVTRSAEFARAFLAAHDFPHAEIDAICNMISCTGVNANLQLIPFREEMERTLGYALATADLLGQMAAPDYVEKLPILFEEFAEAVHHDGADACRLAAYRSAHDLTLNTPSFWANYVLPKIQGDFGGLHRFLNVPYPDGPNPYLSAIERNLARISQLQARQP